MTDSEELKIVIRAVDEASKVLKDVKKQLGGTSGELQKHAKDIKNASAGSSELHKEWQKLFSASKYLEEGIQDLRRAVTSIIWTNVALAISSVVMQMITYAVQAGTAKTSTEDLARSVADQAKEWGLLPDKINNVSQATIDFHNLQVSMAQWDERHKGKELEKQIKYLTELNERLQRNLSGLERFPEVAAESASGEYKLLETLPGTILKNKVALAEAKKELEVWQQLQGMKPAERSKVQSYINRDDIKNAIEAEQQMYATRAALLAQYYALEKDQYTDQQSFMNEQLETRIVAFAATTKDQVAIGLQAQILWKQLGGEWKQIQEGRDRKAEEADAKERQTWAKRLGIQAEAMELQKESYKEHDSFVNELLRARVTAFASTTQDELVIAAFAAKEKESLEQEWSQRQKEINENRKQNLASTFQFISQSALRENKAAFEVIKVANIAQAIMDTFTAANVALKSAPPPWSFALAAAVVAAGLANVQKIASTKFGSTGGPSGAGGGSSSRNFGPANTGQTAASQQSSTNAPQKLQIIVYGNIVDHAAFVRELQPYFKEVIIDTV